MTTHEIQTRLVSFLQSITGNATLDGATDLHAVGATDSLTMMDLLVFIETEFQTRLEFTDLTPEAFRTAGSVAALIASRRAHPPQAFAA